MIAAYSCPRTSRMAPPSFRAVSAGFSPTASASVEPYELRFFSRAARWVCRRVTGAPSAYKRTGGAHEARLRLLHSRCGERHPRHPLGGSPPRTRPHLHLAAQRRASCHRSARRVTAGKGPGRRCAERGPSLPPQSSPKHPPERLGGTAGGSRPRRRPENQPQLPPHWHGPPDWQPQEQPGPQPQLERWGSGVEVRGMGCLLGKRGIGCRPLPLEARSTRRINGARWHGAPSNGSWTEPGAATRPPPVPARRSRPRARR